MALKKVFVLERAPLDGSRLARLIIEQPGLSLSGIAADPASALAACAIDEPDVLVVDLSAETGDGVALIAQLRAEHPHLAILALSSPSEARVVERIFRAGATGYVALDGASGEVLRALDRVLDGELYLGEQLSMELLKNLLAGVPASEEARIGQLSERESEVFRLLGEGSASQEIAERLGLSVKTVDTYRERIKDKLDLADFRQLYHSAIRWAIREAEQDASR